jgi:hypothetical protein
MLQHHHIEQFDVGGESESQRLILTTSSPRSGRIFHRNYPVVKLT